MQQKQNNTGLVWFTNNLRTQDNSALTNAIKNHTHVIAIYIFDKQQFTKDRFGFLKTEVFRAQFLIETVTALKNNLADLNISLFTYFGAPEVKIAELCQKFSINSMYTQKEWTRDEVHTANKVKNTLNNKVNVIEDYSQFLYHPNTVSKDFTNIPNVFTVFRKQVEKTVTVLDQFTVSKLSETNSVSNNTTIPSLKDLGFTTFKTHPHSAFPFKGGENEALKRLDYYLFESKKVSVYKKTRNGLIGTDYSTKFSPWLANGSLSAKTIYFKIKAFEEAHGANQSTYWVIFELIWRDYFKYIALKYKDEIFSLSGILNRNYTWQNYSKDINKWINGQTKDNFVNANMLELKHTGFMSNRGRQNVASYFAKELLLDWRIGAAYFESMLVDYDVHSNYGNWMYVAGVGNDPRDRKFNTKLQADRYDTNHKYRNLWLQNTLF